MQSTANPTEAVWLKHYAPISVLRAADVLADHVDFWEEEAFKARETGKWRERELTEFIRSGASADAGRSQRFKQLLAEYIVLSALHPPKGDGARIKALEIAVVEIGRWLGS